MQGGPSRSARQGCPINPRCPTTHFQLPGEGTRPFNFGRGRNKDFYLLSQPARDDRIWGRRGGEGGEEGGGIIKCIFWKR